MGKACDKKKKPNGVANTVIATLNFDGHVNLGNLRMASADFTTLDDGEQLDDNVLTFFMEWHRNNLREEDKNKVEIMGASLVALISSISEKEDLLEVIRPLDLLSKKVVFAVINNLQKNGHWSLLVFLPSRNFYHIDSISEMNREIAMKLVNSLSQALNLRNPTFIEKDGTRQDNAIDCGLFVIESSKKTLEHVFELQKNMLAPFGAEVKIESEQMRQELKRIVQRMAEERED
jgi:Ulp1 family protease